MTVTDPGATTTQPPALPPGDERAPGDREMTMLEHLEELRQRLIIAVASVVVGILVSIIPFPGADSLTHFAVEKLIALAAAAGVEVIGLKPGESFFTFLEVSLVIGAALAMPVIIYQLLAFVTPALYPHEKRYLYIAVPGVTLSFVVGLAFCYVLMLPFAIRFLGGFANELIKPTWSAAFYLNFVTSFMFWVGLTFELPIVMYFLSKLGVVSADRMARFRKYAIVLAFVLGAIITPTPDPINQTIISLPIYFLFELGIILARFA